MQLQSELTPFTEVDSVVTVLADELGEPLETVTTPITRSSALGRGIRIATFSNLALGRHAVRVTLRSHGELVSTRPLVVSLEGNTTRTVLVTRDCGAVRCDEPGRTACLGGRCVPETCSEESPEACGPPLCTSDAECPASPTVCAPSACSASGTCLRAADDALCDASATCDALRGCVASYVPCDWSVPSLATPEVIVDTPEDEEALTLSRDGLRLFFTRWTTPEPTVTVVERSSLDAPFGAPRAATPVEMPSSATGGATFRRDGLEVFFAAAAIEGGADTSLFHAVRATTSEPWGSPTPLEDLSTPLFEFDAFLEIDGLTLWFERQSGGTATADVFRARRPTMSADFGPAEPVPGLSMADVIEANPAFPDDRSVVSFTRSVEGENSEIYFAPLRDGVVGVAAPITALSSPFVEYEATMRFDGCEVFFVSNRTGTQAIYRSVFTR